MFAAIYARVSTEEQAKTGYSIQDQIAKCEELARELGATHFEHFIDDGYSGADPNRPALQRLLQEVA
ncbi:recombinase family protein, partial [Carboxydothermus ferrireducens]